MALRRALVAVHLSLLDAPDNSSLVDFCANLLDSSGRHLVTAGKHCGVVGSGQKLVD
jgi:hypothetical protein